MDSWPRYATSSWFWVVRCSCVIKFSSMESEQKWNMQLCLTCLENAYSGIAHTPFPSASWKWEWEDIPWKLQREDVGAVLLPRTWHPETEIPSCYVPLGDTKDISILMNHFSFVSLCYINLTFMLMNTT